MCQLCGVPEYITCNCEKPVCIPCENDSKCVSKIDAECVVYHLDDTVPTKLTCLGIPNKSTLEFILEAIDTKICNASTLQTPISVVDTQSVNLTVSGVGNHTIQADVKISPNAGNNIVILPTGLYSPECDGKVKVNAADDLDYLEDQVIGGTDGIVTITVTEVGGQLVIAPSINIVALLDLIESDHLTQFCNIVSLCQTPIPPSCGIPTNLMASMN